MLNLRLMLCALAVAVSGGCHPSNRPVLTSPSSVAAASYQPVAVEVVGASGQLPTYLHGDSVYVQGRHGERYDLRVMNNSGARVEAVVTVDGRDVVSGELGDYRKQRGYVIEPWSSVVVSGFRQSGDRVAAFVFSELSASYSARRGTPQHVGVIGVAVFREKPSAKPHYTPIAAGVAPRYEDVDGAYSGAERASAPRSDIGTAYGPSRPSVTHQTRFTRHRKRRPDARITMYYDSREGLQAKGILPYEYRERPRNPEPFPGTYAPPPPPRW